MLKKVFSYLISEILYNGHLQSLGAVSLVIFSAVLFDLPINIISLIILYLAFYIIYLYNRHKELNFDEEGNRERTRHLRRMDHFIPRIIFFLTLIILALLYFSANIASSIFVLLVIIFGFLYTDYFKKLTRYIFIFKNIYVSLVFALLVFYPYLFEVGSFPEITWLYSALFIFIFFRSLLMQIFLDLKDIVSDKAQRLRTVGALFGYRTSLKVVIWGSFLSLAWVYFAVFIRQNILSPGDYNFWLYSLVLFEVITFSMAKSKNKYSFVLKGAEFIFWSLFLSSKIFF